MPAILLDIIIAITIVEWLVLRLMIRRGLLLSLLPGVFLVLAFKLNAPDVLSWPTVLCLESRVLFMALTFITDLNGSDEKKRHSFKRRAAYSP